MNKQTTTKTAFKNWNFYFTLLLFLFTLKKKLNLSSAENKLAQNRAIRWQDLNTVAMKYTLGPEKSTNLMISEQLDRPIIKTFQKHPGNQLPEAQEIIKVRIFIISNVLE